MGRSRTVAESVAPRRGAVVGAEILRHAAALAAVLALALLLRPHVDDDLLLAGAASAALAWALSFVPRLLTRRRLRGEEGAAVAARRAPTGGAVLFLPAAAAIALVAPAGSAFAGGLLAGALLLLAIGLWADLRGPVPLLAFLGPLVAGGILLAAGVRVDVLSVPGLRTFEVHGLEAPLLLAWVVLVTHAFRPLDDLGGLVPALGLVALGGLAWLGVHPWIAVPLFGALLGFLPHALPRARLSIGRAGTLALGFVVAALVLEVPRRGNLVLAIGLVAFPLADTLLVFLRRFVRGKPLLARDRSHVHHKLEEHLGGRRALALLVASAMALLAAWLALRRPDVWTLVLLASLWLLLAAVLVVLGRVELSAMTGARAGFQRLHLLRHYVLQGLELARSREEVERRLRALVRDLPLAYLEIGDLRLHGEVRHEATARWDSGPVEGGRAVWAYVPTPEEPAALRLERRTVLSEIAACARRRLA